MRGRLVAQVQTMSPAKNTSSIVDKKKLMTNKNCPLFSQFLFSL